MAHFELFILVSKMVENADRRAKFFGKNIFVILVFNILKIENRLYQFLA